MYSSTEQGNSCHRGDGPAGYYGAETSDCDSPITLLNATFNWIRDHIKDEIDFVVWTGDSARHDNDEKIPRSDVQIINQNQLLVTKFLEVFGKPDNYDDPDPLNDFIVPIVPTFGNNDVFPHNTMSDGPNKWTRKYLDIWRQFIPEEQRHQFARGGWFFVEVIPKKLAVISLNTLYFFASNNAVDGCAAKSEPGYEHMEWLRIQLQILRQRGMKAIVMGHVPPARVGSKTSWDETCWQKYTLWMHQYRDVVVSGLYGHMNLDHFMIQDLHDVQKYVRHGFEYDEPAQPDQMDEPNLRISGTTDYLLGLRNAWAGLPNAVRTLGESAQSSSKKGDKKKGDPFDKIGGEFGERFSVSIVSPSVVPNFFPTLRIFSYNISGLEHTSSEPSQTNYDDVSEVEYGAIQMLGPEEVEEVVVNEDEDLFDNMMKGKSPKAPAKERKRRRFTMPEGPSKSAPPGPAYSPQTLSLLSFKQYYANLTILNNDFHHNFTKPEEEQGEEGDVETSGWKSGKHSGKVKKGKPHPKKFEFKKEYDTADDRIFRLPDLTVRNYLKLAKRIALIPKDATTVSVASIEDHELPNEAVIDLEDDTMSKDKDKKKKHKGDKKHHKKHKMNKTWFTFVKRAFVGAMDADDIRDNFGPGGPELLEQDTPNTAAQ